ncbi:MAG: hypothetical protein M3R38_23410 [Actinomycetota bacterium]|nr:hypothetical protein [Actinomycetota bacterium]
MAAKLTGRDYTYVIRKCKAGEVPGAEKRGKYWEIPAASLGALQKRPTVGDEKKHEVIRLRFEEGMKYEAIARTVGISTSRAQQIGKQHEEEEAEIKRQEEAWEAGERAPGFNESATITVRVAGRIFRAERPTEVRIGENEVWELEPGDTLKLSYSGNRTQTPDT